MARDDKYFWTNHSKIKMRQYRLTESRVKRIIRHPSRIEEGIFEGAVACMQPAGGKQYSEIWTLYLLVNDVVPSPRPSSFTKETLPFSSHTKGGARPHRFEEEGISSFAKRRKKIKIITAWRYPGRSPARDPIPAEVLKEIRSIL